MPADAGGPSLDRASRYLGVSRASDGRWQAAITVGSAGGVVRRVQLGFFEEEEEAARAYDRAATGMRAITLGGPPPSLNLAPDPFDWDLGGGAPAGGASGVRPAAEQVNASAGRKSEKRERQKRARAELRRAELHAEPQRAASQYRGVRGEGSRWRATLRHGQERIDLGLFDGEVEAARARDAAAVGRGLHLPAEDDPSRPVVRLHFPGEQPGAGVNGGVNGGAGGVVNGAVDGGVNGGVNGDASRHYRGVDFIAEGRWLARIRHGGAVLTIGRYATAEAAARAYDQKATECKGGKAVLNFPLEGGAGGDGAGDGDTGRRRSRLRGVYAFGRYKWEALIRVGGKIVSLGRFRVEEDAGRVYDAAVLAVRPKGRLNYPAEAGKGAGEAGVRAVAKALAAAAERDVARRAEEVDGAAGGVGGGGGPPVRGGGPLARSILGTAGRPPPGPISPAEIAIWGREEVSTPRRGGRHPMQRGGPRDLLGRPKVWDGAAGRWRLAASGAGGGALPALALAGGGADGGGGGRGGQGCGGSDIRMQWAEAGGTGGGMGGGTSPLEPVPRPAIPGASGGGGGDSSGGGSAVGCVDGGGLSGNGGEAIDFLEWRTGDEWRNTGVGPSSDLVWRLRRALGREPITLEREAAAAALGRAGGGHPFGIGADSEEDLDVWASGDDSNAGSDGWEMEWEVPATIGGGSDGQDTAGEGVPAGGELERRCYYSRAEDAALIRLRADGLSFKRVARQLGRGVDGCRVRWLRLKEEAPAGVLEGSREAAREWADKVSEMDERVHPWVKSRGGGVGGAIPAGEGAGAIPAGAGGAGLRRLKRPRDPAEMQRDAARKRRTLSRHLSRLGGSAADPRLALWKRLWTIHRAAAAGMVADFGAAVAGVPGGQMMEAQLRRRVATALVPAEEIAAVMITTLAKSRVQTGVPLCGVCPACRDRDCFRIEPERKFKNQHPCVLAKEALRRRKQRRGGEGAAAEEAGTEVRLAEGAVRG